ncbi:chemotaxis protein CheC [Halorientalis brevis]|uniref:Chemotaxis protein CheC n=1 Tax=Halorientalis brevis TaxID=1126241 RepID=A0ABD6CC53_9EURY|nr:chemotaxis protein CheC [Halorientalis brevis]
MDVDIDSLETLNLLTREGAQEASDALGQMVDTPTVIDVTKLLVADSADITADIHSGTKHGVQFDVDGKLSGTLLFTFDQECIDTVTELLVPGAASDSMARSSVTELANIMMGGFLAGWGDHLETGLDASPPTYLEADELDAFEIESLGPDTNSVLAFGSTVMWRDNTVGLDIYLIPDRESIETVLQEERDREDAQPQAQDTTADSGGFGFNQGSESDAGPFADDGDDGPFGSGDSGDETVGHDADTATADDSPFGVPDSDDDSLAAGDGDAEGEDGPFDDGADEFGFEMDDDAGADSISLDKLSVFSDLTKEGTEAAAEQVTMMTGIETTTEIAGITFTPIEDIPETLEDGDYVGTTGEFEGTPSGYLIIMFDEQSARNIAEAMMPVDPGDADGLTDMHESAIEELGNIMTSGFIDGWANVLQTSVEHTPPEFAEDMEMAFMEILTDQLGQFQTHAFSIESAMHTPEIDFNCKILALPNEAELETALDALDVDRQDETDVDPDDLF